TGPLGAVPGGGSTGDSAPDAPWDLAGRAGSTSGNQQICDRPLGEWSASTERGDASQGGRRVRDATTDRIPGSARRQAGIRVAEVRTAWARLSDVRQGQSSGPTPSSSKLTH